MIPRLVFLAALVTVTSAVVAAAETPVGRWNPVDDRSGKVSAEVEIYEQGGKLFGRITKLTEPTDEDGNPRVCTACRGQERDRPLVGLVIMRDLCGSGGRYTGGSLLDPEDGKLYKAELWVDGSALKVRGSLGLSYKTQRWVRAR